MRKSIDIEGIENPITLSRRRGAKSLKIAIKSNGNIMVTVPYGLPEIAAKRYIKSKMNWINQHAKPVEIISNGARIGKAHLVEISASDASRSSTKIKDNKILIRLPENDDPRASAQQEIIKKACIKALVIEASKLLPQRLDYLSARNDLPFTSCDVKKLRSRWGSCDHKNNITLNCFLMQLDWKTIDYVLCHELAHTVHKNHSKSFWLLTESMIPDFKEHKKILKGMPTDVLGVGL